MKADIWEAGTPDSAPEPAKRRQILDGARRVFLADGFDGASMNDIARVAGVSKGTLYVYFDSKESLFEALIREDRQQQAERFILPVGAAGPRETLTPFGQALLEKITQPERMALLRIVIAATSKFPSLGRAFYESGPRYGETRLAEHMEAWRAGGLLQFDDSLVTARHFLGLCKSGVFMACLFGETDRVAPEVIGETVDHAVEAFMRAYGTRPSA
jgi:AcrR family transcriptional regulator